MSSPTAAVRRPRYESCRGASSRLTGSAYCVRSIAEAAVCPKCSDGEFCDRGRDVRRGRRRGLIAFGELRPHATAALRRTASMSISVVVNRRAARRGDVLLFRFSCFSWRAYALRQSRSPRASARASTASSASSPSASRINLRSLRRSQRQQVHDALGVDAFVVGKRLRSATGTSSAVRANMSAGRACSPSRIHDDNGACDRGSAHD